MVRIISGDINSGKTKKLLSLYNKNRKGDGFLISKIYIEDKFIGQEIVRLSTREKTFFSFKEGYIPSVWDELYHYDVFSFSRNGFEFAERIIRDILRKRTNPVYIDEIGPLELEGKGFHSFFPTVLSECKDLIFTVRKSCLKEIIEKYSIREYIILLNS